MQPTETQIAAFNAYKDAGYDVTEAAKKLGIKERGALQKILFCGHLNGLTIPTQYCEHLPAGIGLKAASVFVNKNGEKSVWYKGEALRDNIDDFAKFAEQRIPIAKVSRDIPKRVDDNLMVEWPIYDAHHGMLAWEKETGNDYNHKVSRQLQIEAASIIYGHFGQVNKTTIILGGDNQTTDNRKNITEKAGNTVDTDSRFHRIAWCCYETSCACIDMAKKRSREVDVIVLSGNHDYHSAIHLSIQLYAHYRNDSQVTINTSPAMHRFYRWGNNYFMASHGATGANRLAPYLMQHIIRNNIPNVQRMYVRLGHLHKTGRETPPGLVEDNGVIIERFPTLAAQEAYSVEEAYTSIRSTSASLWHDKYGKRGNIDVGLGEILERIG